MATLIFLYLPLQHTHTHTPTHECTPSLFFMSKSLPLHSYGCRHRCNDTVALTVKSRVCACVCVCKKWETRQLGGAPAPTGCDTALQSDKGSTPLPDGLLNATLAVSLASHSAEGAEPPLMPEQTHTFSVSLCSFVSR